MDYPAWICEDCGRKWGRRSPSNATTWYEDICGICGKETVTTEPRDFGHLKDGWEKDATTRPEE